MAKVRPAGAALAAIERRLRALGCGDSVAGLHFLVGVEPAYSLFPHSLSPHRNFDPAPCEGLLRLLGEPFLRSPRRARAHALRGRLLRVLDRKTEALAAFDRALESAPQDALALGWRAECLLHVEGLSAKALRALTAAAEAAPDSPWPAVWAAAALLSKGAGPEVFAALDSALGAGPRNIPALLLRAVAHERCSRFDLALADAAAAARLEPACAGVLVLRGRLEARLGRPENAAATLAAATRLDPGAKAFYEQIVIADPPLGKSLRGIERLDEYIRRHPNTAWAYALRGDVPGSARYRSGEASADLKRAVELAPGIPWMRACLARHQVTVECSEDGLRSLRTAIKQDPRCGWLHAWLAESYRQFNRRDEAVPIFKRAIALSPGLAQIRLWLGRVQGERGRWELAVEEFTRAIRLDCDYGFAYGKRGHALAQLGRHVEALPDFERALALGAYPDWVRAQRASSLRAVGKKGRAR